MQASGPPRGRRSWKGEETPEQASGPPRGDHAQKGKGTPEQASGPPRGDHAWKGEETPEQASGSSGPPRRAWKDGETPEQASGPPRSKRSWKDGDTPEEASGPPRGTARRSWKGPGRACPLRPAKRGAQVSGPRSYVRCQKVERNLDRKMFAMAAGLRKKARASLNKYERNAVSRSGIRTLLKKTCTCVHLGGQCFHHFGEESIVQVRQVFHTLEDVDKSFLVRSMTEENEHGEDQRGSSSERPSAALRARSSYALLGHSVCKPAFCQLLGIGSQMDQATP